MSISQTICDFATLAIEAGGWMEMDRLYLQNRLLVMKNRGMRYVNQSNDL